MTLTKSLSFSLGRKRILISNNNSSDLEQFCADFESYKPLKRQCNGEKFDEHFCINNSTSLLEALPQEVLIKVVCGVDHDDLEQLYKVSKTVRDAAIITEKLHFNYNTPSKVKVFRNAIDLLNNPMDMDELEAPNAPKQVRRLNRPRISRKKLDDISVALFSDKCDGGKAWPRRSLFTELDS